MKVSPIALIFLVLPFTLAAPADNQHAKPEVPKTTAAGNIEDKKSAGSPEELNNARTHPSLLIDSIVRGITSNLQHSNILYPSIRGYGPLAPSYPLYAGSYGYGNSYGLGYASSLGGYGGSYGGYGASYLPSLVQTHSAPVASVVPSIPAVPALPAASVVSSVPAVPALPAASVVSSVPAFSSVSSVPVAHSPVASTVTSYSKPVVSYNQHVVQQPVYSISQQVIHKPVYTDIVEVVHKPVIAEVQQIIHKPVLTELQQVIKQPLYTQHIIKPGYYDSVKQEISQPAVHLQGDIVHVHQKPTVQVIPLPEQIVQPVAAHVVQTPVVHQQVSTATTYQTPVSAVPVKPISSGVAFGGVPYGYSGLSGLGYGISGVPSSFGYNGLSGISSSSYGYGGISGYSGLPFYGYGSGYGSGFGSGYGSGFGYSALPFAGSYGATSFITPSLSCRAKGNCPKDANGKEIEINSNAYAANTESQNTPNQQDASAYFASQMTNSHPFYPGLSAPQSYSDQLGLLLQTPKSVSGKSNEEQIGEMNKLAKIINRKENLKAQYDKLLEEAKKVEKEELEKWKSNPLDFAILDEIKRIGQNDPSWWSDKVKDVQSIVYTKSKSTNDANSQTNELTKH